MKVFNLAELTKEAIGKHFSKHGANKKDVPTVAN